MNQTSTIPSVDAGSYSCRFEVVIFQAIQNIVFQSSMPGAANLSSTGIAYKISW